MCLLTVCVPLLAQGTNLDLEQGAAGWVLSGTGATVASAGAAQGTGCLRLVRDETDAWALSPALPDVRPGEVFALSLSMRRVSGEGELSLAVVEGEDRGAVPPLWQGALDRNLSWRRLSLQIVCGLASPRVVLEATGAPCEWLVDNLRVEPARVPPVRVRIPKDRVPEYCENLPEGWDPGGDMDLLSREIMGMRSYHLRTGSIELNPLREVTVLRGERTGMLLDALLHGTMKRDLQVGVNGPVGWRMERWSMPVPPGQPATVSVPLQAMTAGDFRVKVAFGSGSDTRQMPVTVHSQRQYPALGVNWRSAEELPADLTPFRLLPAQFHHATLEPGAPTDWLERLADTGADLGITVQADVEGSLQMIGSLPAKVLGRTHFLGFEAPQISLAEAQGFYEAATQLRAEAVILGQTWEALNTGQGLDAPDLAQGLQTGVARWAHVARLQLPPAPRAAVLRETADGPAVAGAMPALQLLDRVWSAGGLRALLQSQGAALPLYAEYTGRTCGDPNLDAFVLAKALIQVVAMGANGFTLDGRARELDDIALLHADGTPNAPLMQVYGELCRELASAHPLAPPEGTALAAYEPGRPVTYRPFIRGDEGILALWNNTAQRQEVAVDVRSRPLQVRTLRISYPGELCVREFDGAFEWDALARRWGHPAVYLQVEPLQVVVMSLKLRGAHNAWLREVGPQPPKTPPKDPNSIKSLEERGWRDE